MSCDKRVGLALTEGDGVMPTLRAGALSDPSIMTFRKGLTFRESTCHLCIQIANCAFTYSPGNLGLNLGH
jgi:hypothetical protein